MFSVCQDLLLCHILIPFIFRTMQPSGHYYYPHFIDREMKVLRVKWCEDTQLLHGRANIRPKQLVPELILLTSTLFSDTQITASWHILQFCNSTLSHSDFYSEQHSYYPSIGKSETLGRHGRTYKFQRKKKWALLLHYSIEKQINA